MDKVLVLIFVVVIEVIWEMMELGEINGNVEIMMFLNKLKLCVGMVLVVLVGGGMSMGVGMWVRLMLLELFCKIFMVLWVVWWCWFEVLEELFVVEEYCVFVYNIDCFFEVDMLNWGDFVMVQFVVWGGLGDFGVGMGGEDDDEVFDIFVGDEEGEGDEVVDEVGEEDGGDEMEIDDVSFLEFDFWILM